jgi:hypothetical protein
VNPQEIVVGHQVCGGCYGDGCGRCGGEGECDVTEWVYMDDPGDYEGISAVPE